MGRTRRVGSMSAPPAVLAAVRDTFPADVGAALVEGLSMAARGAPFPPTSAFARLLQAKTFAADVYGGFLSAEDRVRANLPTTLPGLLADGRFMRDASALVDGTRRRARSVLDSVKERASGSGESMDAETERELMPMVLREAFAHELSGHVRRAAAQSSALRQLLQQRLSASSERGATEEAATASAEHGGGRDALPEGVVRILRGEERGASLQVADGWLGEEWAEAMRDDVARYVRDDDEGAPARAGWRHRDLPPCFHAGGAVGAASRRVQTWYPALWIAMEFAGETARALGLLEGVEKSAWALVQEERSGEPMHLRAAPLLTASSDLPHAVLLLALTDGFVVRGSDRRSVRPGSVVAWRGEGDVVAWEPADVPAPPRVASGPPSSLVLLALFDPLSLRRSLAAAAADREDPP
jgi:hypothetical protein